MAGYVDHSMSNNALAAYNYGLVPASKIPGIPAALVKKYCRYEEWHHTSSRYNMTEFYNPAKVRAIFGLETSEDWDVNPSAVAALAAHKTASKSAPTVHQNCHVEWLEWSGTRNHPKATECSADGCSVTVKGQTATITFANGRTMQKRLTTNGFSFREISG